jgi:hypothetical protein
LLKKWIFSHIPQTKIIFDSGSPEIAFDNPTLETAQNVTMNTNSEPCTRGKFLLASLDTIILYFTSEFKLLSREVFHNFASSGKSFFLANKPAVGEKNHPVQFLHFTNEVLPREGSWLPEAPLMFTGQAPVRTLGS